MNTPKNIPEEFLQFIWENGLYLKDNPETVDGKKLEILSPGKRNSNSGPDFFNARIKIDDTEWAGNVEIHKKASDWYKHNHHNDEAYNNVVLHVVEDADERIERKNGETVPVFILNYAEQYKNNYQRLLQTKTWIPCEQDFHKVNPVVLQLGFNRLMIERLENKTAEIEKKLAENNHDWNETFYQYLAKSFGFKVNALPFELLAKAIPLNILAKHKNNSFQLEALLFGVSGLLNEELVGDDYYLKLREEFSFLFKKYNLKTVEAHLWKFMRLRPVNFPTIRISQFAALIHRSHGLFSKITDISDLNELKNLFRVKASAYWESHYKFNKVSERKISKELGEDSVNMLLINVIIPFLFVYGNFQNREYLKNRALEFIEKLPVEKNSIIRNWKRLGIEMRSAFDSQALLQLKNVYCEKKKCLNCRIGSKLIKSTPESIL